MSIEELQPHERGIIACLDRTGELISLGMKPEYVSEPVRRYLQAAAGMALKNYTIEWLTVRLLAGGEIDEIIEPVFGQGGVDPAVAVESAQSAYVSSELDRIINDIKKLNKTNRNVKAWLPQQYQRIGTLLHTGQIYDPRPSEHFKQPIPQVNSQVGCFLDDILRGGIYGGALGALAAMPGSGKSTMAYTLCAWLASKKIRCVLITGEETEQYCTARVLMAWVKCSEKDVVQFQLYRLGKEYDLDAEKIKKLNCCLDALDTYLRIYNQEQGMDLDKMDAIISWERPQVIIIDHLMMVDSETKKQYSNEAFDIGEKIYRIRAMVVQKHQIQGIVMSQMPEKDVKLMASGIKPKFVTLYGSGMINQATHWTALMCRHPSQRGYAQLWYQKSKIGDPLTYGPEDKFLIEHDITSQSFVSAKIDRW